MNNNTSVKIPLLTQEELNELGSIMHKKNEFEEVMFWERIYKSKGLEFDLDERLVKLFDNLATKGRMHLNFAEGASIDTMTDEDKINIMKIIYKIEVDESNKQ